MRDQVGTFRVDHCNLYIVICVCVQHLEQRQHSDAILTRYRAVLILHERVIRSLVKLGAVMSKYMKRTLGGKVFQILSDVRISTTNTSTTPSSYENDYIVWKRETVNNWQNKYKNMHTTFSDISCNYNLSNLDLLLY